MPSCGVGENCRLFSRLERFKRKDTCSPVGLRAGKMGVEVGKVMGNSSAELVISPRNQYLA